MSNEYTNPHDMSEDQHYAILLVAFVAFVMKVGGCNQKDATARVAAMCALTQQVLEGK